MNAKFLLIFLLAAGLVSCTSDRVLKKYYILSEIAPEQQADSSAHNTISLNAQVTAFKAARAYQQNRIALRTQSNELSYFYYHNWADNPASAVRYFVWNKLNSARLFKSCLLDLTLNPPDIFINGYVEQIERTGIRDNYSAHLKMYLEVVDVKSGDVLLRHSFDRSLPIEEDSSMNLFTQKISRILTEETNRFMQLIEQHFN